MSTSVQPRMRWLACLVALALVALAAPAQAQFDSGQINGFVRDSQGAPIPGATVRIINEGTKLEKAYTTDTSGYYVATTTPARKYQVVVELTGFRKYARTGITLDSGAKIGADAVLAGRHGGDGHGGGGGHAAPDQHRPGGEDDREQADPGHRCSTAATPSTWPCSSRACARRRRQPSTASSPTASATAASSSTAAARDENLDHDRRRHRDPHRAAGAIIGTVNVDTVQEIQVLTASYLPEYGRSVGRADPLRDQGRRPQLPRRHCSSSIRDDGHGRELRGRATQQPAARK